jgi:uncharacterized membrane protein YoaK (UPF0700 family)
MNGPQARLRWIMRASLVFLVVVVVFLAGVTLARIAEIGASTKAAECSTAQLQQFARGITTLLVFPPEDRRSPEALAATRLVRHAFDEPC